uniref:Uncharacterized protein n=1 Tax=Arundo donax TaxID=35708 RepID=A0A0A8XVA6_ARUDO
MLFTVIPCSAFIGALSLMECAKFHK